MGVCVCLSHTHTHTSVYLFVYVMEAILAVLTRGALRDVRVCLSTRDQGRIWVCFSAISRLQYREPHVCVFVCICNFTYVNTTERLQLHKAVIVLLIMKCFVLKIVS